MNIVIREYRDEDLDQITALEKELFSSPWSREALKSSCDNGICWVMETDTLLVIAYLIGVLVLDEFSIYNIAVSKVSQNKGYASKFISFLKKWLQSQKCEKIFLEVRSLNREAIGLYRKCGFKPLYLRRYYYQNPVDDAITMVYLIDKGEQKDEKL